MWWLISVLYAAVGLLSFRARFRTAVKAMERDNDQAYEKRIKDHKTKSYCGYSGCSGRDHVPPRPELGGEEYSVATGWGLLYGVFWLPIFTGKVFWKGLFPKGVLAETSKERKQRLKKEAEAEAEALLKKAKEMGLLNVNIEEES